MLHNLLLAINRINLTEPKDITIQKVRYSFIHLNMLSLSPGVWERVGTQIIIFLDSLTLENAVLFSPKEH